MQYRSEWKAGGDHYGSDKSEGGTVQDARRGRLDSYKESIQNRFRAELKGAADSSESGARFSVSALGVGNPEHKCK
jgi:hypothetical protein